MLGKHQGLGAYLPPQTTLLRDWGVSGTTLFTCGCESVGTPSLLHPHPEALHLWPVSTALPPWAMCPSHGVKVHLPLPS